MRLLHEVLVGLLVTAKLMVLGLLEHWVLHLLHVLLQTRILHHTILRLVRGHVVWRLHLWSIWEVVTLRWRRIVLRWSGSIVLARSILICPLALRSIIHLDGSTLNNPSIHLVQRLLRLFLRFKFDEAKAFGDTRYWVNDYLGLEDTRVILFEVLQHLRISNARFKITNVDLEASYLCLLLLGSIVASSLALPCVLLLHGGRSGYTSTM